MSNELGFIDQNSLKGFDSRGIVGTSLDDLNLEAVVKHMEIASQHQRFQGAPDPIAYLRQKRCIVESGGQAVATPAGILCFGKDPQALFPSAVITIVKYRGVVPSASEQLDLRKGIGGTLFEQIEFVEAYLRDNTLHPATVTNGFQRVSKEEYPNIVRRELALNAIGHRDYKNLNTPTRVQLFYDRLEFFNPGGVPEPLNPSVEEILKFHEPRNPVIFELLYQRNLVESIGSGIDSVMATLRQEGMRPPQFDLSNRAYFMVTVFGKPKSEFDLRSRYTSLTDRQLRILEYLRAHAHEDVTPAEVKSLFATGQFSDRVLQRDIKALVQANLVRVSGHAQTTRYKFTGDES